MSPKKWPWRATDCTSTWWWTTTTGPSDPFIPPSLHGHAPSNRWRHALMSVETCTPWWQTFMFFVKGGVVEGKWQGLRTVVWEGGGVLLQARLDGVLSLTLGAFFFFFFFVAGIKFLNIVRIFPPVFQSKFVCASALSVWGSCFTRWWSRLDRNLLSSWCGRADSRSSRLTAWVLVSILSTRAFQSQREYHRHFSAAILRGDFTTRIFYLSIFERTIHVRTKGKRPRI